MESQTGHAPGAVIAAASVPQRGAGGLARLQSPAVTSAFEACYVAVTRPRPAVTQGVAARSVVAVSRGIRYREQPRSAAAAGRNVGVWRASPRRHTAVVGGYKPCRRDRALGILNGGSPRASRAHRSARHGRFRPPPSPAQARPRPPPTPNEKREAGDRYR